MATSRSQLDRVLDPTNVSVQLDTLIKAARALGKEIEIKRSRSNAPPKRRRPERRAGQGACRTFAEVSYALLCTVMQFATDVTARKQRKVKNLGVEYLGYEPGGCGFKSCRARQYSRASGIFDRLAPVIFFLAPIRFSA